jgi:hypothetical protein
LFGVYFLGGNNMQEFVKKYGGLFVDKQGGTSTKFGQGDYGGQCVSLVQHFFKTYVKGYRVAPYGDAKNFIAGTPQLEKGVLRKDIRDGDIVVWHGGKYGHIGIMYQGKVFSQNPHVARLDTIEYFDSWGLGKPSFYRPELTFTPLTTVKPKTGRYVTQAIDGLRIRTGPGVKFNQKLVRHLTKNGQENVIDRRPNDLARLRFNTAVDVIEVKQDYDGNWWGKIPSGWISLTHTKKT